jgi:hypothetical protein
VFRILADSLTSKILLSLPKDVSTIQIISSENKLSNITNYIIANLIRKGLKINVDSNFDESLTISFSEAKVEYQNLFKEHFFGNYLMTRRVALAGNVLLFKKSDVIDFNFTQIDTVEYENFRKLENKVYPFTEGEPPKEPFFSNLIEPVIAIAATATAVLLFFTVRSK